MARKQPPKQARKFRFGWRGPVVFVLATLGILGVIGFSMVHWTERQVLTTDNWVKLVAPLPKNDQVSTALSQYSVDNLFSTINLQQKVSDALPPRASFLAGPLVDQLQTRTQKLTKNIIQSDRFQTIWVTANRVAHARLMAQARGETNSEPQKKLSFNLDLSSLRTSIRSTLGITGQPLFSSSPSAGGSDVSVAIKLKTKLHRFSELVKAFDFLNATLWLAAIASLLGALVISYRRRRLLMIISLSLLIVGLLQLIGVKAVRPALLDHVQNSSFRPAVGVIYDDLLASFRHSATVLTIVSVVILAVAYLTQNKFLNKSKFIVKQMKSVKQTSIWKQKIRLRKQIRQYRWWASLAVVIVALALSAFVFDLDWRGLTQLVLATVIVIELVHLSAFRPRQRRAN